MLGWVMNLGFAGSTAPVIVIAPFPTELITADATTAALTTADATTAALVTTDSIEDV